MPGKHYNKDFGKSPMKKSSGFKMNRDGFDFGEGTGSSAFTKTEKTPWETINAAAYSAATGGTTAEGFGKQGSFADFAGKAAKVGGEVVGDAISQGRGDSNDGSDDEMADQAKQASISLFAGG